MLPRPMRAPIAVLAAFGLLAAMTAIPVTADSHDACASGGQSTGEVADGVTITYDSLFVCTDAAASGTWSITVEVTNDEGSSASVELSEASLSHTSPRPDGEGPEATATTDDLPVTAEPGATVQLGIGGDYELMTTGDGDVANLHLRLTGATGDDTFFMLGLSVQILGPGMEPDLEDPEVIDDPNGDGEGRPEWVPGPPPWVRAILEALFANGFPWGTDDFPPAIGNGDDEEGADGAVEAPPSWVPGPPPWAPVPPQAGGEEGEAETEDDGPPAWVPPAGPPDTIPAPPTAGGGR